MLIGTTLLVYNIDCHCTQYGILLFLITSINILYTYIVFLSVYLEISRLQSEVSAQNETQQQLLEDLNSLKTKYSNLSDHKQNVSNEGGKLLVSMQTFYDWTSL